MGDKDYILASQPALIETLKKMGGGLGQLLNTGLNQQQLTLLKGITEMFDTTNSLIEPLYSNQDDNGDIGYRLVDFSDLIQKVSREYVVSAEKSGLSIVTKLIDRVDEVYIPEVLMKGVISTILDYVVKNNANDVIYLSVQNQKINEYKYIITISISCHNCYAIKLDLNKFLAGNDSSRKSYQEFKKINSDFKKIKGKVIADASRANGVSFIITVPYYIFNNLLVADTVVESTTPGPIENSPPAELTSSVDDLALALSEISLLIVDDSRLNREIVKIAMKAGKNIRLQEAESFDEAMLKIAEYNFDIIITDIHMPSISGISLVKEVKNSAKTKNIPVLGLTADTSYQLEQDFIMAGGTELMLKPVDYKILLDKVTKHALKPILYDKAEAKIHSNNSVDLEKRLQKLFLKEVDSIIDVLNKSEEDIVLICDLAHKLVSSATYCGYLLTRRKAMILEQDILNKASFEVIKKSKIELYTSLKLTKKHIESQPDINSESA